VRVSEYGDGIYNVAPMKVIDPDHDVGAYPQLPDAGKRFVAVIFTITGISGDTVGNLSFDASVVGTDSQSYGYKDEALITSAGSEDLIAAQAYRGILSKGDSISGTVSYALATGVTVRLVKWTWKSDSPPHSQTSASWLVPSTTAAPPTATSSTATGGYTGPGNNLCGAPPNPWGYNFCGGNLIYNPPNPTFCSYFNCIASFWTEDRPNDGYVIQCVDSRFSLSGGEAGSPCSSHGGPSRTLYAP
jgi:hypothetical protein